jgi:hypothetical protein
MSGGNGPKYVTLDGKTNHLYAETEATVCGIPVPIAGGAEWTYTEPEKVCPTCTKAEEKATKLLDERAPFDVETPLASDSPTAAPKATKEAPAKAKAK